MAFKTLSNSELASELAIAAAKVAAIDILSHAWETANAEFNRLAVMAHNRGMTAEVDAACAAITAE